MATQIVPAPEHTERLTPEVRALLVAAAPHVRRIGTAEPGQAAALSIALTAALADLYPVLPLHVETQLCRRATRIVSRRDEVTGPELTDALDALSVDEPNVSQLASLAVAGIDTTGRRTLSVVRAGSTLVVITEQPGSLTCRFAVDTYRLPTVDELDPEQDEVFRRQPGEWVLVEQAGDDDLAAVERIVTEAVAS